MIRFLLHTMVVLFQDGFAFERPSPPTAGAEILGEPEKQAASSIAKAAHGIHSCDVVQKQEYDPIMEAIGNVGTILIGESTHGTHEFYQTRANLSKRLIVEKHARVVCIEGDFPAVANINRYILDCPRMNETAVKNANEAMSLFQDKFPVWMWRNTVMEEFLEWLKEYNVAHVDDPVHMYGLDMQGGVAQAIQSIETFANQHGKDGQRMALNNHLSPIKRFADEGGGHDYSLALMMQKVRPLSDQAQAIFELMKSMTPNANNDIDAFEAQRMAALIMSWEHYNRAAIEDGRGGSSWDIRDCHFFEMLHEAKQHHGSARAICWAHNSHLGDARATELGRIELNLGQLVRENYGDDDSYLVGFSTYSDDVTASTRWGGKTLRQRISVALPHSYGALMHEVTMILKEKDEEIVGFFVTMRSRSEKQTLNFEASEAMKALLPPRLQRAIGVQYRKSTERESHYFSACLPLQFDTLIHIDETQALEPLDGWDD